MAHWCITVFCRNEQATISACLKSIEQQIVEYDSKVFVVINGCSDGTKGVVEQLLAGRTHWLTAYEISFGDKANAWNQFVHILAPVADAYFFVDGYVEPVQNAFKNLFQAILQNPKVNAATTVPTYGRSAPQQTEFLRAHGGLQGGMHVLAPSFVERIKEKRLQLPLGLYRGDGLIGSMAMHDLDPISNEWSPERVAVVEGTSWKFQPLTLYRPSDIRRQFRRVIQQARGEYENAAIKEIIYSKGYEGLPQSADHMILEYIGKHDDIRPTLFRNFPGLIAQMQAYRRQIPTADRLKPRPIDAGSFK